MKPIFTSILAICAFFFTTTNAQTTFAPAGAEWYHEMSGYGVFHCYNAGDSTILGKTCSSIRQNALVKDPYHSMGLVVYDRPTLYTYTSGDTVFIYNTLLSKFTPLYIFNVSDGDTVCIPTFFKPMSAMVYDTTFCYVVDSVRNVLYDGISLKTVYTRSLRPGVTGETIPTYGLVWEDFGVYAERLGCLKIGIYPQCYGCPVITSESNQTPGAIRCYNDPWVSIKLVPGICGIPPVSVAGLNNEQPVAVYPNPANDLIKVATQKPVSVTIMTVIGVEIATTKVDSKSPGIDVSALPPGIYLLRIIDGKNTVQNMRVQITH